MDQEPAWLAAIDRMQGLSPENLFIAAGIIQDAAGCVPRAAIVELAKRTGMPQARIWGALTAYPGFKVTDD